MILRTREVPGLAARPYKFKGRDRYMNRYAKDRNEKLKDPFVTKRLASIGLHPRPAPRSVYKVEKLFEALTHYSEFQTVPLDAHFRSGVRYARRCFECPDEHSKLKPLSLIEALEALKPNTSAGLTSYGASKSEVKNVALSKAERILSSELAPEPCLAFARTQKNEKTRLVWGYPMTMTLLEAVFAVPLIEHFKRVYTPMHFSIKSSITSSGIRSRMRNRYLAVSLDYSQFDASISAPFAYAAFGILASWFNLDGEYSYMHNGEECSITLHEIWNLVVRYFVNGPIVMPDGMMYHGRKGGVPSGSFFTQIIDSIVNTILVGMLSHKFRLEMSTQDVFILGDDCLIFLNDEPEISDFSKFLSDYGFVLNPDKCEISPSSATRFLGRTWVHGEPTEDLQSLVDKICYPERFRKYSPVPQKREAEVDRLLWSYAATYRNFSGTFLSAIRSRTPINFEVANNFVKDTKRESKHLSGMTKFKLEYLDRGEPGTLGSTVWK